MGLGEQDGFDTFDAKLNAKLGLGGEGGHDTLDSKLNATFDAKLGLGGEGGHDTLDAKLDAKFDAKLGLGGEGGHDTLDAKLGLNGFANLDAKLDDTIRTAFDDKVLNKLSIANDQSVNLMDWEERIANTERLVGTLVQSVPSAALRELKNHIHVVGAGTDEQNDAIGGTLNATWTYMTSGCAKLAVSCEHNALKYETEIDGYISTDKAFIELPQELKGRVKAIGLLGSHKYGSSDRHPKNDIVVAVLRSFPPHVTNLPPTPWEVHADLAAARQQALEPRRLMDSNILGATLAGPVVGYGARKIYETGVYEFHQTSEISKGGEGGLMHCVNNDGKEEVLGVYVGATAVDQGYLGRICPLMSFRYFGFHDVVNPPTAGSTVKLVTRNGIFSTKKNIDTITNGPASYPNVFPLKNNGQPMHGVFIDFSYNEDYTSLDKVLGLVHVNEDGIGVEPLSPNLVNGH